MSVRLCSDNKQPLENNGLKQFRFIYLPFSLTFSCARGSVPGCLHPGTQSARATAMWPVSTPVAGEGSEAGSYQLFPHSLAREVAPQAQH